MWDIFEPQLAHQLSEHERSSSFEARTRAVVLDTLPRDEATIEVAARRLATSPRTLQRRLADAYRTYAHDESLERVQCLDGTQSMEDVTAALLAACIAAGL